MSAVSSFHDDVEKKDLRSPMSGLFMFSITLVCALLSREALRQMAYESSRVLLFGWLTCITTGLGALPFFVVGKERISDAACALANSLAGGMMLSASCGMLYEAYSHSGPFNWQSAVGLGLGVLFIRAAQRSMGDEEANIESLHCAVMSTPHLKKAILIFTVMFCHSAAEGIAVGVSFDKELDLGFGFYISILLAVHNIPEGLAMALVLVPRGVSASMAAMIAILTSIPQPLMALIAFYCVGACHVLLPFGLAFAAGAMIYVSLNELMGEATEHLSSRTVYGVTLMSFISMCVIQVGLHTVAEQVR
jgi:zinc transporter ZupT